ncbi:tRNA (adenosine(37)-N6)-dimethylallyltransferase MiaA [Weeksella sp. HMSC059D05]|uniref:tRNA (adenosine(37)-N6)-dimethylallyltransferase MiaA n=1 Tax=Weeksella sp. HMSC059D05 TaxID=1715139 RepID=UPI0008A3AA06|nr:tRNA (adenosine(37)-N6)-dimethylallyltransferase MiaA [Weeksella sp. HMSC059D05]OFM85339.1 tRNA dimethylallyltransferase [Weeksella sp. HMSC059D05]
MQKSSIDTNKKYLISLVGPTAIGKTDLAIFLAKNLQAEILSNDSRQFFKELSIGTAVPTKDELAHVPHHFIQHISIEDDYSVGDFEREALAFLENYFNTNNIALLVGGSGLYEKALTQGLDYFPEVDPLIRETLNTIFATDGIEVLQQELAEKDPEYFAEVDQQNGKRIIRALEIIRGTGNKFSSYRSNSIVQRPFEIIKIGLDLPREELYDRINRRVDFMMENNLLDEVKEVYPKKNLNALQTVGYRELFCYLDQEFTLEQAVEEIKKNTRRFAKRQLTWFRKDKSVCWFSPKEGDKILAYIKEKIK